MCVSLKPALENFVGNSFTRAVGLKYSHAYESITWRACSTCRFGLDLVGWRWLSRNLLDTQIPPGESDLVGSLTSFWKVVCSEKSGMDLHDSSDSAAE